jgi:aspartyl-tRNA(Asn)/glutamyl-tRNA(Gln) amidotransferase subunit A
VIGTADAVRRGDLRAVDVLDDCLAAIRAGNTELNAFVHIDEDVAGAAAEAVDAAVARGDDPGPLAGVPFGIKDLEDCAGMPTSHGSLLYKGGPPVGRDSVHVGRLRAAGAVPVGKTAAPEFGSYAFTQTLAWGTTRNPWNPERTPGGSSGGSAAAVASGMVPFCTASDGGGSTRIPAAFCGLPGFKATYGRIPHEHPGASLTSCFGALTTTVADAARHLDVAAGPSDRDKFSLLPLPPQPYEQAIETLDVRRLRAVWSGDLGFATVDPEVEELAHAAALELADAAGLDLVDRPVRFTEPVKLWLGVNAIDIWQDIERDMWPARADDIHPINRFFLKNGESFPTGWHAAMIKRRQRFEDEVADLFADVDVLLTPTTAVPAFAADGPMPTEINGETLPTPAMAVPFTMLANLCWNPAMSLPAGMHSEELPVGLQVTGRRGADDVVLRLGRIYEQVRPWPRIAPNFSNRR